MTSPDLTAQVWGALARVKDPEVRRPITELGMVQSVQVGDAGTADVSVLLTIVGCPAAKQIEQEVTSAVQSVAGVSSVNLDIGVMNTEQRAEFVKKVRGGKPARTAQFTSDSLTRVIAVTSGKGGVGKSSLTAALAVGLAQSGLSVGLIDADVFGFSIPGILGLSEDARPSRVGDLILPPEAHGVKVISIGMFLAEGEHKQTAVAWRGPMLHRTIEQFLNDVWFGDLDVLLLDLPPGTGDVALSVGQLLPHAEVLVVTTPQAAAADVAVRSGLLAHKAGQKLLGVVENMSGLAQPDGSVLEIFGSGGGIAVAEGLTAEIARDAQNEPPVDAQGRSAEVPLLANIPLSIRFREAGDHGEPLLLSHPEDPASVAITELVHRIVALAPSLSGRKLPLNLSE